MMISASGAVVCFSNNSAKLSIQVLWGSFCGLPALQAHGYPVQQQTHHLRISTKSSSNLAHIDRLISVIHRYLQSKVQQFQHSF